MSNTCFASLSAVREVFRAMIIWCTKWCKYLEVILLIMHHINTVICYQNDIFCIFLTTKYKRSLVPNANFVPLGSLNVTWFRLHFFFKCECNACKHQLHTNIRPYLVPSKTRFNVSEIWNSELVHYGTWWFPQNTKILSKFCSLM